MDNTRVFGPVPSRRLGKSIGINNIPPKTCTYSCVYCQLGRAARMTLERQPFYDPDDLLVETTDKLKRAAANNEHIDYLTIVPDGEPTLDINLGRLIDRLKPLGFKVAVITNASLMGRCDVRQELRKADWVSVKIDTVNQSTWRKIDRPLKKITLESVLSGIAEFARDFTGCLITETMLVKDVNDHIQELEEVAQFIGQIQPDTAYLSIPTRPPAEQWVEAPEEASINRAFQIFSGQSINTEYLIGYEGNEFAYTGHIEQDILSITSVHPMREDAVREYLKKANGQFSLIDKMVREKKIIVSEYNSDRFYLRKFSK